MYKLFSFGFWNTIAGFILRNRITLLVLILIATVFLSTQWEKMRFSYTEANLLPDEHIVNLQYKKFLDVFGDEGNLIVIATDDQSLFTSEKFQAWNNLATTLEAYDEVDFTIGLHNLQRLNKENDPKAFVFSSLLDEFTTQDSIRVSDYKDFFV